MTAPRHALATRWCSSAPPAISPTSRSSPRCRRMVRRGALNVPVDRRRASRAGPSTSCERARATASSTTAASIAARSTSSCSLLRYVDGDYADPATFAAAARARSATRERPLHYLAIPPSAVRRRGRAALAQSGCADERARRRGEAVRARPGLGARAQRDAARGLPRVVDLPHRPLPRQGAGAEPALLPLRQPVPRAAAGTATTSTTCRSRWPRRSASQGRGKFYEETGAIRDVIQNHLLQVRRASWRWTRPSGTTSRRSATRRRACSRPIAPLDPAHVVRGQFRGYRDEPGVARDSTVETFAAVKLHIDTWRWAGVPFFIRAGKCLPVTRPRCCVELKRPPRDSSASGRQRPTTSASASAPT